MKRPRVVCFDLDGTLVPTTTVCLHLSQWLGHTEEMEALEEEYAQGTISNRVIAEREAIHYRGVAKTDVLDQLESMRLIEGLPETMQWLRAHSIHAVLATVTWKLAAEFLQDRFGFDAICGCDMAVDEGGFLGGQVSRHIEAEDKIAFLRDFCYPLGIQLSECVAVGDSRSDIPLFHEVGLAIALNATPAAEAAADVALRSEDLREIIPIIEGRV